MKALRQSGKRFLGGVLICGCLAVPVVAPMAAHAASLKPTSTHSTTLHRVPKRCQWIVNDLNNLSPADFPNQQAYQAAVRALLAELRACEAKY